MAASGGAREITVLVVEDERIVADIYRLALERAGYGVLLAADGVEGLETARTAMPDFIFCDIRLPRMDGIEVLRNLAAGAETKDIPVVMLSNYDDPALINQSRELGAREYIVKAGTKPSDLAAIVARWVGAAPA